METKLDERIAKQRVRIHSTLLQIDRVGPGYPAVRTRLYKKLRSQERYLAGLIETQQRIRERVQQRLEEYRANLRGNHAR